jgi:histidinol-phosphate aminotransferase
MIKAPGYVLKIKPYVPGKPVEELERELGITGSIKLASNENPLGPSGLALRAAEKCLPGVNRYPDGNGFYLKRKISEKLRVDEECIILGNGSNELLSIAARTFLNPGDEAIMAAPSFVVYPMATVLSGANPVEVPLRDWRHDLPAMARAITPRTRLLIIANPNNPTGTINSKEELRELMSSTPEDMLVVMDEAYYEYVTCPDYADSMEYLFQGKNILILRTFSKVYGLAGLRIGYGVHRGADEPRPRAFQHQRGRAGGGRGRPGRYGPCGALG